MYIIHWESVNVLLRYIFKIASVHTKVMYMNKHTALRLEKALHVLRNKLCENV